MKPKHLVASSQARTGRIQTFARREESPQNPVLGWVAVAMLADTGARHGNVSGFHQVLVQKISNQNIQHSNTVRVKSWPSASWKLRNWIQIGKVTGKNQVFPIFPTQMFPSPSIACQHGAGGSASSTGSGLGREESGPWRSGGGLTSKNHRNHRNLSIV